jgi:excisionase family DNA binding protein
MVLANIEKLPQMLTVRDVAQLLNIHVNTVRRWADHGILRAYRITSRGDRRFKREDISHFLYALNNNGGDPQKASLDNNDLSDK